MAKDKTAYVCTECGYDSAKWIGKCPACGQWNTIKEITIKKEPSSISYSAGGAFQKSTGRKTTRPTRIGEIQSEQEPRIDMNDAELNRVLGGGMVPGSLVLLGGEPGIGKSTLLLQTVLRMPGKRILYVSGEESERQIKLRSDRIEHEDTELLVVCETHLEQIFDHVREIQPELLVVDSIQTVYTDFVESSPGSISQVRECAVSLLKMAKETGIPII
jgi:DNA repair protein RadA/Sms